MTAAPTEQDSTALAALRALVRLPTVARPDGAVPEPGSDAAEAFDDLLDELASRFPLLWSRCEVLQHSGHALLIRWAGSDPDLAPVVLMAHSDVVPVAPDDVWTHPPFGADVVDGQVWGRGTLDCKGSLVAQCAAVERLLAADVVPRRDVWLSFGSTEEVAGPAADAAVDLLHDRGVRPWFVLDEGGAVIHDGFPGLTGSVAVVGVAEKGLLDLDLVARADGGHSSTPARGGATARLSRAVLRLDRRPFPSAVPAATVAMLRVLAGRMRPPLGTVLGALTRVPWLLARVLPRLGPEAAAMARTTVAVTMLRGSPGANVIAGTATAHLNVRVMVGESTASAVRRIRRTVRDRRISLQHVSGSEPSPVSPVDDAVALLERTCAAVMPDVVVAPYVVMAATDARFFHRLCPRVYRFVPFRMSAAQRGTLHNADERLGVEDFLEGIRWYTALLRAL